MTEVESQTRTIWVVDDSPTDAERVRRILTASLYQVEVISDGATALERLSAGRQLPDLLLLDWIMPGISGIEVCKFLRSGDGKMSQIPILLLTANQGPQEISQAFASGANDYVSKPFIDEELKARVNALLQNKRLFERVEQAEADVRAMLTNAPDPIFVIDAQGLVTFANKEGLDIFGGEKSAVLGQSFSKLVPGMSLQNIGVGVGESVLPLPDITIKDYSFSPSIRVLPSDNSSTTTIVLRNVTARRQADERRLDFYSMIAHDLRTPITSVLLRLQMALRGNRGILPPEHIADLRKCDSSLRSLSGMINDFLELARLEGIGNKIDLTPVNLGERVRTTMDDFAPLLEKGELTWTQSGLDGSELVMGDQRRLSQVLSNLIGNAIKFTPPGGKITTSLSVSPKEVEVVVQDTGRGIPKNQIPRLFERFSRAPENGSETIGTGLGLMIVREIIEAHGGVIQVESEVGVGSKFWFRLPRNQEIRLN